MNIYNYGACRLRLDLVFLLDQSGSVGSTNHITALQFINNVSSYYNVSTNETQASYFVVGCRLFCDLFVGCYL